MDARQARLEAERDGADKVTFPDEILARRNEPEVAQATASEQRLFELRRSAREGQKAQLLEQIDQLRQQILGNDEQVAAKSKEIELEPAGAGRHPRPVEAEPGAVQPRDHPGARLGAPARRARRI